MKKSKISLAFKSLGNDINYIKRNRRVEDDYTHHSHIWRQGTKTIYMKQLTTFHIVILNKNSRIKIKKNWTKTAAKIRPKKHFLVFKTSWRLLQDMSWRGFQHIFSVTILRLPRRLEDVLRRRLEDVLKTFSRPLARGLQDVLEDEKFLRWRRLQDILKTCLEDVLKTYFENKIFAGDICI